MKFSVFNVALFTATSKESNLCDDKWHSVEAKLIGNVVELVVDGGDSQYGSSQNTARNVTTSSALYVGGVPGTLIFTHFIFNIFLYHVHHQLMNKCYHSCIEIRNLCLFYWFWTTSLLCDVLWVLFEQKIEQEMKITSTSQKVTFYHVKARTSRKSFQPQMIFF